MLHTTFARAKEACACITSYHEFAKYKGGIASWGKDKPFPLSEVLEICGFGEALWALRIVIEPADKEIRCNWIHLDRQNSSWPTARGDRCK